MMPPYQFSLSLLPMVASAALMTALGIFGLRHRSVPGARPFAIMALIMVAWAIGAILEVASVDVPTKIAWFKFQAITQLPTATAAFWFALEYANLDRWLTHRTTVLLTIPPLLLLGLVLTNDAHHLFWLGFSFDGTIQPVRGNANWIFTSYGYLLALLSLPVFMWLFIRSPLHRASVAIILFGMVTLRAAYLLDVFNLNPVEPMDPTIVAGGVTSTMYALALFRFHMFDLIPIARETVIAQMQEGMLILDRQRRIIDLNPAAEKILEVTAARVRGRQAHCLPVDLLARLDDLETGEEPVLWEKKGFLYSLRLSTLNDQRGLLLGHLVLFYDMTEQRRAQKRLVEQQRAVATLQERERLARELHDSVGQVLGYANVQVEAARKLLGDGQIKVADTQLARLANIVRDAHADVREYILSLRIAPSERLPFFTVVKQYLDAFSRNHDIQARLVIGAGLDDLALETEAQVHLLHIIQEALSNARRHADARCVQVTFESIGDLTRISIQDDGRGFDPGSRPRGNGNQFGMQFMRERAEQLRGRLTVDSTLGKGTRVVVEVPVASEPSTGE